MITKAKILQSLLLVFTAASLVNCSPAVPCNIIGNGGGSSAARLMRASSSTNICGSGGGGGGGTCSSTLTPTQVMLSVDSTGKILEYGLDATTGVPTLMCNTATAAQGPLVATPNNNFVYVLDSTAGTQIFGFQIAHAKSGALATITGSPFQLSTAVVNSSIAVDPLGRFIFVTDQGNNAVHVLAISQSGALAEVTGSPFLVSSPTFIAVTPSGAFAYVTDQVDGDIFIFSLASNGTLTETAASPFIVADPNDSPGFALVHPTGNFLLTANLESTSSFTIDPNNGGALTQVGGSPFLPANAGDGQVAPLAIVLDATGKFLYVVPRGISDDTLPAFQSENIIGYTVDTTGGGLTPLANSPFLLNSTLDIIANPLLQQMIVATSNTTSVLFDVAPIDANGNLTIPTSGLAVTATIHPVVVNIQ